MLRRSGALWRGAIAGILAVAVGVNAVALGDPPGKKEKKPAAMDPPRAMVQTRVFMPKHTDPAEVLQAMELFLESAARQNAPAGSGAGGPAPGAPAGAMMPGKGGGGIGGPFPPGGISGMPGMGGPGSGITGLGGLGGGEPLVPYESRLVLDERTGSIVVRGPENEVQMATDLVTLLDTPADKPLPEVKSLRAFALKHATPTNLAELTSNLEIRAAIVGLDEAKLLLVAGSPEVMRELADLVKTLDVPAAKASPEKRKRLFPPDAP